MDALTVHMKRGRTPCLKSFKSSLRRRSNSPDFLNLRAALDLCVSSEAAAGALFHELGWIRDRHDILVQQWEPREHREWQGSGRRMRAGGKAESHAGQLTVAPPRCAPFTLP